MENNVIRDLPIRLRTEADEILDSLSVELHTALEEMASVAAEVINQMQERAATRAVRVEQMRIAEEINELRWWNKKRMVETDKGLDSVWGQEMPLLNFIVDRIALLALYGGKLEAK